MSVRNVVKVMNFHALIRVNNARRKVEKAYGYETELQELISSLVNNRVVSQEGISLTLPPDKKELNIYIGSDLGFCASFNSEIISYIRNDAPENDKIIIGKRVMGDYDNVLLYMEKEMFPTHHDKIYDLVLDGVLNKKYSKVNVIYIHYYNLNRQELVGKTILPFDFEHTNYDDELFKQIVDDDYAVEGNLEYILWNLVSVYVTTEIKIAEMWSWASENVKRQTFTNESLKKIDEREEIRLRKERKEKKQKSFSIIVEANNKKIAKKIKGEKSC